MTPESTFMRRIATGVRPWPGEKPSHDRPRLLPRANLDVVSIGVAALAVARVRPLADQAVTQIGIELVGAALRERTVRLDHPFLWRFHRRGARMIPSLLRASRFASVWRSTRLQRC